MKNKVTAISASQLERRIAAGDRVTVLDVRPAGDYKRGHIKNAVNYPYPWKTVPNLPEGEVVVVCYFGMINRMASKKLARSRSGILRLKGGMSSWLGEVVRSSEKPQGRTMERYVRLVAGILVVISVTLGYFTSPWWFALTGFVGFNLIMAGLFNWCFMLSLLRGHGMR